MGRKVYLMQDMDPAGKNYLTERGYELVLAKAKTEAEQIEEVRDCDAIIVRVPRLTAAVIKAAPHLKVIARHGVGVDNIDLACATELGIQVTNGPYSNTESVAEHTVALTLALGRKLPLLNRAVREGDWGIRNRIRLLDLQGKTLGIVGSGRIGLLAAKKLHFGFDMQVLTWGTRHPEKLPDYIRPVGSLTELAEKSDVLSLHCPSTKETRGLIDAEVLNAMKEGAYLINTARGDVVDRKALYQALVSGHLAGAAFDVFDGEPADPTDPLFTLDNFLITPHCSSHTPESFANMSLHAAIGVDEVLSGRKVSWPVNQI